MSKPFFIRPLFLGVLLLAAGYMEAQRSVPLSYSGSAPINYIRTYDALAPEADPNMLLLRVSRDVRQTTQYLDGLGRPVQTVIKQGSLISGGTAVDMVSTNLYDEFGRQQHQYLVSPANNTGGNTHISDGLFKLNPFQQQAAFYDNANPNNPIKGQGEDYFYGQTNFEASPLNRVLESFAPGDSWVGTSGEPTEANRRSVKAKYWTNTTTDVVRIWNTTDVANNFGTYASASTYAAGELYKQVTVDEQGKQVIEFKDKQGLVVLKKVQLTAAADDGTGKDYTGWLCTYYIYDDLGRLRAVIQPEGVKTLAAASWSLTTTLYDEQCFRYEYDAQGRMIRKKVPGAGEVFLVYDARDRLVMSQDANLRGIGKWLVTKYDELNRPVETGLLTNNDAFTTHLAAAAGSVSYPATTSGYEELTKAFYDDYSWLAANGLSTALKDRNTGSDWYFMAPSNSSFPYPQAVTQSFNTKGMVTGTKTKVLGGSQYLYSFNYYDDKGRVIQNLSQNSTGGNTINTTQYSFSGQVLMNVQYLENFGSQSGALSIRTLYEYDELGRLLSVQKKPYNYYNGTWVGVVEKEIVRNEYDALGQLAKKKLAPAYNSNAGLETEKFDYNIRGWMLGMNRDYAKDGNNNNYFGFDLGYDKANNGIINNYIYYNPQFNGNISGMVWKSKGDQEKRKYDFYYDAANRLLQADFNQYLSGNFNKLSGVDFSVKMGDGFDVNTAYDANGNIKQMQQWGLKLNSSSQVDNMRYTYIAGSNKLKSVTDFNNDPLTKLGDFKTSATHPQNTAKSALLPASPQGSFDAITDYSYDVNGNLNLDNNKAISSITYNHLNLPSVITVTGKGTITYTYDAAGNKLKKVTVDNTVTPSVTTTTLYIGGAVYENEVLQFIGHEEGRMRFRPSDNTFQFDYMLKDHLGNVRAVLTEEQQTDAYPAATMETANAATEEAYYSNLSSTRVNPPSGYPANTPAGNAKVAKVNGSGNKIGPAIILKVMAGDKFNLQVNSFYKTGGSSPGLPVDGATDLVTAISGSMAAASGGKATALQLASLPNFSDLIGFFMDQQKIYSNNLKPTAYVSWIAFDEQFNYEYQSSGFEQVGNNEEYKTHLREGLTMTKSGYLYIYVSNETPNIDVFFDNLQVTHVRGSILEETHYYPFGLTMAGISNHALAFGYPDNKKKYQGYESNKDFDLNTYETFYRTHDPQIGRWWQIDPKPESALQYSPYVSMNNNPISLTDFLGDIVEYERGEGVSRKEFRRFKREIRQMSRNSESFRKAFKEFKKSDRVFAFRAMNHDNGGRSEDYNKETNRQNINIGIHTKFPENPTEKSGRISTVAHETGHAWLKFHGKQVAAPDISDYTNSSNTVVQATMRMNDFKREHASAHNENEGRASHFQNIVTSELVNSGNRNFSSLNLAEFYFGGEKVTSVPGQLPLSVDDQWSMPLLGPPRTKDYYFKTKFNINDEF